MVYTTELRYILEPTFSLQIKQNVLYHTSPKEKYLEN